MAKTASKGWSPERRAAASEAAKQRIIDANAAHERGVTARNFPNARPITNPERQRPDRQAMQRTERRRRKAGTLNRMAQMKLDIFTQDQLDPNYIYRVVTDNGSRLRQVTKMDDYDFVNASEIEDFSPEDESDSEGSERVRWIVGEKKNGQPQYGYLVKKPREFWEEDNRMGQDYRDDQLNGRVYKGEADDISARVVGDDGKLTSVGPDEIDTSNTYVPPGAALLHGVTGRRRGPVQPPAGN